MMQTILYTNTACLQKKRVASANADTRVPVEMEAPYVKDAGEEEQIPEDKEDEGDDPQSINI